jgi:hypothetical protein
MSSDRTGAVGEAAAAEPANGAGPANGAVTADAGSADRTLVDDAQLADPWFAAGPKVNADPADAADSPDAAGAEAARQAEWFLPTGRAGLLPDSMTVAWDDDSAAGSPADHEARIAAAGAPPWAGETADASASTPPPWETGPWPGPGGLGSPSLGAPGDGQEAAGSAVDAATDGSRAGSAGSMATPGGGAGRYPGAGGASLARQDRWPARTVVTAGLLPLVVPGLVVGILSLRQPGGRPARTASWLAIGTSIAWAVIIILIVAGISGGSAGSCGGYPAAVHQAYEKAMTDLSDHAPAPVQAADLDTAANRANASAAAAGQLSVRTALFVLANDMAQARADIVAHRPVPVSLRQHLAAEGAAPTGSCAS